MTVLRVDTIAGIGTTIGPLFDGNLEFNSQNYIVLPKGSSNQQGVLRTTVDVVGTGGTYYDNLVLAMPFNAATGLTDVSSRNRNPGAYGNVAISTAQSKYYGSSAYFDGSGDYIDVEGNADFAFGTGDFTVEGWVNTTTISANGGFYRRIYMTDGPTGNANANFQIILDIYNQGSLYLYSNVGDLDFITTGSLANGQWNHFAVCRSGTTLRGFVNGVSVGSTTYTTNITANNGRPRPRIGSYSSSGGNFGGYLQDLRIYKGIAKYTSTFTPPERIAEVGVGFKTGALRYNTDSNKPELYDGNQWVELQISNVGLGTGGDTGPGARGVFGGGTPTPSSSNNVIQYINISSTGNSIDFGDLTITRLASGTASSSTRGVWAGGSQFPVRVNNIDYVTISSTGDAIDFGDLSGANTGLSAGVSNSTRGCFGGGDPSLVNTIQYITIASTGDAKDFGDLLGTRRGSNTCSSPTRGIFAGGNPSPSFINTIEFITLSSLGNSQDFGDLVAATDFANSNNISNSTRGVFAGGANPTYSDDIQYITISSLGNAVNFGNLSVPADSIAGCSSPTRGVFAALRTAAPFTITDTIEYISIQTQGNSVDFGNLLNSTYIPGGLSNAHGGL